MDINSVNINQFADVIEKRLMRGFGDTFTGGQVVSKIAIPILEDIQKNKGFNDYTGNLGRSYYVRTRFYGEIRTFASPESSSKRPISHIGKNGRTVYYELRKKRHPAKGKMMRFGGGRKRHYRTRRPNEYGSDMHRYFDPVPHQASKTNKNELSIVIGNETPYAPFVQQRGYKVFDPVMIRAYRTFVQNATPYYFSLSVRKAVKDINKGYFRNGRFHVGYTKWWLQ